MNRFRLYFGSMMLAAVLTLFSCSERSPEEITASASEIAVNGMSADAEGSISEAENHTDPESITETDMIAPDDEAETGGTAFSNIDELLDTKICGIQGETPEYTRGVVLRETLLYPAPGKDVLELGTIYPAREVDVLMQLTVESYLYEQGNEKTQENWLLVREASGSIAFVRAEDIGNASEVRVEACEPWRIKAGAPCYYEVECRTNVAQDHPSGPLWVVRKNDTTGVWYLEGISGEYYYINDIDSLEMYPFLWSTRGRRAG